MSSVWDGVVGTRVGIRGGYTGWVIGRAIPGTHRPREEVPGTAKRAPDGPAGAGSGWYLGLDA